MNFSLQKQFFRFQQYKISTFTQKISLLFQNNAPNLLKTQIHLTLRTFSTPFQNKEQNRHSIQYTNMIEGGVQKFFYSLSASRYNVFLQLCSDRQIGDKDVCKMHFAIQSTAPFDNFYGSAISRLWCIAERLILFQRLRYIFTVTNLHKTCIFFLHFIMYVK